MITQDVSKDEKAQGVRGNILGNCKLFWTEGGQAPQQQSQAGQGFQQAPQQDFQQQAAQQQMPSQQLADKRQAAQQQPAPANVDFDDDIPF